MFEDGRPLIDSTNLLPIDRGRADTGLESALYDRKAGQAGF